MQLIVHFEHITHLNSNSRRSFSSTWVINRLVNSLSYGYAECIHRNVDLSTEDVQFLQAFRRTFNIMLANNTEEMGLVHHDGKLALPSDLYSMPNRGLKYKASIQAEEMPSPDVNAISGIGSKFYL